MMGRSHGMSGLAAGLGYGALVTPNPVTQVAIGGVCMVFAYVPDADHPGSTVTHSIPILGRPLCLAIRWASRTVYAATKGPRDEDWEGEHRHLSHTIAFALLVGAAVGITWALASPAVFGLTHSGAIRSGWLLAGAAALGCWTHCLGDSLTLMGCPWLWPIPIADETWFEIRPPRLLRFLSGHVAPRFMWGWEPGHGRTFACTVEGCTSIQYRR